MIKLAAAQEKVDDAGDNDPEKGHHEDRAEDFIRSISVVYPATAMTANNTAADIKQPITDDDV